MTPGARAVRSVLRAQSATHETPRVLHTRHPGYASCTCPPTRYLAADEWTLIKEQRFEIMVPSQNPPAGVFLARGWVGHHTPLLARRVWVGHHTPLPLVAGNVTLRNDQTADAA